MKYFKKSKMFANSSKTLTISGDTLESRSYGWYILGKTIKGIYFVNNYFYSATTIKHVGKLRRFLNDRNVNFMQIEAPKGLQRLDLAIELYNYKITDLERSMLTGRKQKNLERMAEIEQHKKTIQLIQSLMVD
jgi:hypothetical protein